MGVITSKVKSNQAKQVEESVDSQFEKLKDRNGVLNVKPADIPTVDDVKGVSNTDVNDVLNTEVKDVSNTDVKDVSNPDVKDDSSTEVKDVSNTDVKDYSNIDVKDDFNTEVKDVSNTDVKDDSSIDVKDDSNTGNTILSAEHSEKILQNIEKGNEKEVRSSPKSLSLTTEFSPTPTTGTDGGGVCRESTLTSSLLENPLLKRADESHLRRQDGELRPSGPLNPLNTLKLGKSKEAVRLELAQTGLLGPTPRSDKSKNIFDTKDDSIIGEQKKIELVIEKANKEGHADSTGDTYPDLHCKSKPPLNSGRLQKTRTDKSPYHSANTRKKLSSNANVPKHNAPASRPLPEGADKRAPVQENQKATSVSKSEEQANSKLSREIELKMKLIDMDML